jgi:hypothetical protein
MNNIFASEHDTWRREEVTLYSLAGGCSVFYLFAQAFQQVVTRLLPQDGSPASEILTRTQNLDQLRALLILLSMAFSIPLFGAVCFRLFRSAPAFSVLGFVFTCVFLISEMFYRGVDLFVVSRKWASHYLAAVSDADRAATAAQVQVWSDVVAGWYFVLTFSFLLGSLCFAVAAYRDRGHWERFLSLLFVLNAIRLSLRIAEEFGGVRWVAPINAADYFPMVTIVFGYLSFWLFRQAREAGRALHPAVPRE